jgi:hypothetical protein
VGGEQELEGKGDSNGIACEYADMDANRLGLFPSESLGPKSWSSQT